MNSALANAKDSGIIVVVVWGWGWGWRLVTTQVNMSAIIVLLMSLRPLLWEQLPQGPVQLSTMTGGEVVQTLDQLSI